MFQKKSTKYFFYKHLSYFITTRQIMKIQTIIYHKIFALVCFMTMCFVAKAQKGTNLIKVSAQLSRPTSALLEVISIGYGSALKGIYDFRNDNKQIAQEGGYNHFPVKKLLANIQAYYSVVPIYAGYRYIINRYSIEGQAGISLNRIIGRNTMPSISKNFEIGVRYRN